jgi:CTP:molybdopterin cytidylyltransferase MocA
VASADGDLRVPPVLVERSHFGVVEAPSADTGLREILRASDEVIVVPLPGPLVDVDTPTDLDGLRRA